MKEKITRPQSLKQLQTLRDIGIATARRVYSIGIRTPEQLKQSHPEKVYEMLRNEEGGELDRCVLYQLRGAVLGIPWPDCKDANQKQTRKWGEENADDSTF